MINVVNKYTHIPTDCDFYIGRGSPLGNPYTSQNLSKTKAIFQCDSREESVSKYEIYLLNEIGNKNKIICNELNKIYKLAKKGDVNILCFCSPKLCHGDIIKKIIDIKIKK